MIKLGTHLPKHLVGHDHGPLRDFVAGLEDIGYSYLTVGDHVLGADLDARPDWRPCFGTRPQQGLHSPQHEVFVLFGLLSGMTRSLEFSTAILNSPQRQTALLAKQAAEVDILTGGRIRLVAAVGWNDVDYEGMGVDFHQRAAILEEQVVVLRRLWTERSVTFRGRFHTITAAGINPLPSRSVPLWFGGQTARVLSRTGRLADGWFPYYPWFEEETVRADLETVRSYARDAGRHPSEIGLEGAFYLKDERFPKPAGARTPPETLDDCVQYAHTWKDIGANYLWVTTPWATSDAASPYDLSEPENASSDVKNRIEALRQFKEAVGPAF
jgi:probable F420-dependent oxidoreductase